MVSHLGEMAVGRKASRAYTLVLWLTKTGSSPKSIVSHTHCCLNTAYTQPHCHSHLLFLSAIEEGLRIKSSDYVEAEAVIVCVQFQNPLEAGNPRVQSF